MKVLIVGAGGREHALAWKYAQSPQVKSVYVAPGNAGTALEKDINNIDIAATDIPALIKFAKETNIDLTVIGPEAPLIDGIVDHFESQNLLCFGPTAEAAQLEGSKAFTKDFLHRHNIPTAKYQVFTELSPAVDYVEIHGAPIVIKADGLAAGKGVIIANTVDEAKQALHEILGEGKFGSAGKRVVIEDFISGEEASFICMVDGDDIIAFATSQDHKAAYDGDLGPNTGGMGAYSPAPVVTQKLHDQIMADIIIPTVNGLKTDGIRYRGFLYAGVMIDQHDDPIVLEFNCRFGDPETQPIMMRLTSDLFDLTMKAMNGSLSDANISFDPRPALGVVLAASGYPGSYTKGEKIGSIPEETSNTKVFHAGTTLNTEQVETNGGRVLCVTALGASIEEAKNSAYASIEQVNWPTAQFRKDIGQKAIDRNRN